MFGILDGCAIGRDRVGMWLVLWFVRWSMIKSDKSFVDLARHG
jgi:hypothetical protein